MPEVKKAKSVDEYLAGQDKTVAKTLASVRRAIKSAAPKAEELISYRLPMYRQNGHLLAFVAASKHCSLITMSYDVVKKLKAELRPYKISGTTIQFPNNKPLPSSLVKKIVKMRLKENQEKLKENQEKLKKKNAGKKKTK